jgi:hypothetical protein
MHITFFEELGDEVGDFFEDFWEHALHHIPSKPRSMRAAVINGVSTSVRPAYLFAERVDNTIRCIFGTSICISAVSATFLGYTKLSDLLEMLMHSVTGRVAMFIIGMSYILIAVWKLMQLKDTK